jgi:hypothetical protein
MLVDLVQRSSTKVAKAIASTPRWRNARRLAHTQALEKVSEEAQDLRRTLLKTYAGERLRRTFDWALSSGGDDDVSNYLSRLTEMEQRLFYRGSSAVAAHQQWMLFGNRRLIVGPPKSSSTTATTPAPEQSNARPVTPGEDDQEHRDKRRRLDQ